MKKLPLVLVCLVFAASAYAQRSVKQYIVHIYPIASSTEKPLDEVTIKEGDNQVLAEDTKVTIMTDRATLSTVVNFARANVKSHIPAANPDAECFGVIVNAQTAMTTRYYLNSHAQTKAYFKRLIATLAATHADKNVIGELQKIYFRVNW